MVHVDWQNNITKDEFQEFQVTGHVRMTGTQVPNLLSGISSKDVADSIEIGGQQKVNQMEELVIHQTNNMVLNEEFEFIMNVVLGQYRDSVLYRALRGDGVANVSDIVNLSESDIYRFQFTSFSTGRPVSEEVRKAFQALIRCFKDFFGNKVRAGRRIHQERQNIAVRDEFWAFAKATIGIKQYYLTQYPDEMDENGLEELSEVMGDEQDCCPHCGWRGFILACDVCGVEEGDMDLVAAKEDVILATKVKYEDDELVAARNPDQDDFDNMPVVFDIEDRMNSHLVV